MSTNTAAQDDPLFQAIDMGGIALRNRVLMAPLTRNRADPSGVPGELATTYYRQRSGAGVIISEATQISPMGKGYLDTPGIHTEQQAHQWKKITAAVHAEGGKMIVQLWHVGRISHVSLLPDGRNPVSSTDKAADGQTFTANGFEDCSKPDMLTIEGIRETVEDYREAARLAKMAGFDGIEVHAANGYLIDQFLQDGVNDRTDAYGGSIENRMKFLEEVLDAVADHWAPQQTGVRLSPLGQANDMSDSDPERHFADVYKMLNGYNLAYLHVVESFPGTEGEGRGLLKRLRQLYTGFYIANGGYDADMARDAIVSGHADAVSFGRAFIANPDLPHRMMVNASMNEPDSDTFYGGGAEGYIDYPTLEEIKAA